MEIVTPYKAVKHNSTLLENGQITPEEFVEAGNSLIAICPTWAWCSADPQHKVPYLPPDKQYLINRQVVCQARAQDFKGLMEEETEIPEFDGWVQSGTAVETPAIDLDQEEEPDDIDDIDFDSIQPDAIAPEILYRTYDITIVYDKYYNSAHVYLIGANSQGVPLTLEQMYQDISADHAEKTVTYEQHPFMNQKALSIHPCQHSHMMLSLINRLDNPSEFCAPLYFFIFLKFIHTVLPTIDISTPSIDGN